MLTWAPSQLHWSQKDNDWTFGETFVFDAEKTKKELDEMFDKIADVLDLSDLPEFDQKKQARGISTKLKQHQLEGVAWMLSRETQPSSTYIDLDTHIFRN